MEILENPEESTFVGGNTTESSTRLILMKQMSFSGSNGAAQCNHDTLTDSIQNIINDMQQCPTQSRFKILQMMSSYGRKTLTKLLKSGAWSSLFSWLLEARAIVDKPSMIEILKIFEILPIVPHLLKSEETNLEVVHDLARSPDQEIREYSLPIFKRWKEVMDRTPPLENEASSEVVIDSNKDDVGLSRNEKCKTTQCKNNSKFRSHGFEIENDDTLGLVKTTCSKRKLLDYDDKCNSSAIEKVENNSPERKADSCTDETLVVNSNENPRKRKKSELSEVTNAPKRRKILKETSPRKRKSADSLKAKKRVSWVSEDQLCQYSYFDIVPGERTNFKSCQPPLAKPPQSKEINVTSNANISGFVSPAVFWRLIPIDFEQTSDAIDNELPEPGYKSVEKITQAEREKQTLSAFYFSKQSIPDSPAEPSVTEVTNQANCIEIPSELENIDEPDMASSTKYLITEFATHPNPQMEVTKQTDGLSLDGPDRKREKIPDNINSAHLNENISKNTNKTFGKTQTNRPGKKICTYFTRGICKFGERCRNVHPTATQLVPPQLHARAASQTA